MRMQISELWRAVELSRLKKVAGQRNAYHLQSRQQAVASEAHNVLLPSNLSPSFSGMLPTEQISVLFCSSGVISPTALWERDTCIKGLARVQFVLEPKNAQ